MIRCHICGDEVGGSVEDSEWKTHIQGHVDRGEAVRFTTGFYYAGGQLVQPHAFHVKVVEDGNTVSRNQFRRRSFR